MRAKILALALALLVLGACGGDNPSAAGGSVRVEDVVAPLVAFVEPQEGTSVSGVVPVEIEATDAAGVRQVTLLVDGVEAVQIVEAPYTWSWDASAETPGPHTLSAKAEDAAGNIGEASITLLVEGCQGPGCGGALSLLRPAEGDFVNGVVEVVAEVEEASGVEAVTFHVDGAEVGAAGAAPFAIFWDTRDRVDGAVSLEARAQGAAGEPLSASARLTVDNTPPTVVLAQPGVEDVVADSVRFEAAVSDNFGVRGGVARVDGAGIEAALGAEGFEGALDVSGLEAGDYTLEVEAVDLGGLVGADSRAFVVDRPPVVSILSPVEGAEVTGQVEVRVEASDDVSLVEVALFVDGEPAGLFDQGALTWDPPVGSGPSTLEVVATDDRGQRGVASVGVLVERGFGLRLLRCEEACAPLEPGAVLSGAVRVRVESDDEAISRVDFLIDGRGVLTDNGAPFEYLLDTLELDDGEVVIRALARAGALGSSIEARVRINNCDKDEDGVAAEGGRCAGADCDDLDLLVFPGAVDFVGDGVDQSCDGLDGVDGDGDEHASIDSGGGDCDDANPEVFPCPFDPVGVCADRLSDRFNCGGCGRACDLSLSCVQGACVCEGQSCDEGEPEDYDFGVPATFFSALVIVTDRAQGDDVDGDGDVDNAFGPMIGELGSLLGADVNAQLRFLISTGQLALGATWPTLTPPNVSEAIGVQVDFFDLVDVDNNPRTQEVWRADRDSFVPGFIAPRTRFVGGVIEGGALEAGPADNFRMIIPLGDVPLPLIIDRATLRGEVSVDAPGIGLADGTVGGVIRFGNFIGALNALLQSDFCSCLGLDSPMIDLSLGNGPRACVGQFDSGTCEQRGQGLCGALADNCGLIMLILPGQMDVDTDNNRRNDAFSVFLRLEGQGADIIGVTP